MKSGVPGSNPILELNLAKILVIRFGRLGDLVLMIPAMRALRKRWPAAAIDVLVDNRYESVLKLCSAVSEILPVNRIGMRDDGKVSGLRGIYRLGKELRKRKYDLVL